MKCNIVKDLLPLYCDKLTSADSNEEIEKHLGECEECKAVYESMNQKEDIIKTPDKDVKPLKKAKKRITLRAFALFFGTLAVLAAAFVFLFVGVIPISKDKLHYTVTAREVKSYNVKSDELDENGEYTERSKKIISQTPMERFGETDELIGTLLWLLCYDASSFVNGVVVPVDGGFSAYSGV